MRTIKCIAVALLVSISFQASSAEKIYFVQSDHLGTPEVLTDENQNVVWRSGQAPFGDSAPQIEQITFNLRFPGQYFDSESGLHYNWNRYYDPTIGRYVTSDPIGLNGGLNTYGYVGGNPLYWIDPTGLQAAETLGGFCASNPAVCGAGGALSSGVIACGVGLGALLFPTSMADGTCANNACDDGESGDKPALPPGIPDFDFDDPTKPPVGQDGDEWEWRGKPPQGGDKGGYKNPNGPESIHPDLGHSPPIGPHWDFNDRNGPGHRIFPDGTVEPK